MSFRPRELKPWMALAVGGAALVLLVCLGAILQIGRSLNAAHPALSWAFYVVLIGFLSYFIVRPLLQTFSSGLHDLTPARSQNQDAAASLEIGRRALQSWDLTPDLRRRLEYEVTFEKDPRATLMEAIDALEARMDRAIAHRAKLSFAGVAISQHGPLDALFLLSSNVMLVRDLVVNIGARPALHELVKVYTWTFLGAFAVFQIEESDLLSWFPALGGAVGRSMTQGAGAAFLTLRVGYLAKAYLLRGGALDRSSAREAARGAARKALPQVIVKGAGRLPGSLARRVEEAFEQKRCEV